MGERLFTMVCEYRGGTYIAQVRAVDPRGAIAAWAVLLRTDRPVPRSSAHLARAVSANIARGDRPVAMDGLSGVWCFTALCGGDLMILDIVDSVPTPG
ncbi:hypothetical protein [Sphingomonas colocasiae]|uniref:Uncharacterized protein n=1 Tax=Sphingomonas colocasiae TaxID=1848973 RepID=A0ABS7PWJ6_9SPHN|nr:hypothetical protein [Sphingomonas colocasiae]MBY8825015.1 hypothetical protein [Sphingomonas colocasiae]